jgi:hypothetical protein
MYIKIANSNSISSVVPTQFKGELERVGGQVVEVLHPASNRVPARTVGHTAWKPLLKYYKIIELWNLYRKIFIDYFFLVYYTNKN